MTDFTPYRPTVLGRADTDRLDAYIVRSATALFVVCGLAAWLAFAPDPHSLAAVLDDTSTPRLLASLMVAGLGALFSLPLAWAAIEPANRAAAARLLAWLRRALTA